MTVVVEHSPRGRDDQPERIHGPFADEGEAMDYGCRHLGGVCGPWHWEHLVKLGEA